MTVAKCDFCEEQHAFLYCKADSARLCLACDHHVHIANPLFLKHARAPLCDSCGSRAATLQCEQETSFLCATCDQDSHNGEGHSHIKVVPLNGCLSPAQLATFWDWHAPANTFPDVFRLDKNLRLEKTCWTSDGSLNSILASPWTSNLEPFLLTDRNSHIAGSSISSNHHLEGTCVRRWAFFEQLEQLQNLQLESKDVVGDLHQESFQEFMALSSAQFHKTHIADVQLQHDVSAQPKFRSFFQDTTPSINKGSWNCNTEKKMPETEALTNHDTYKQVNKVHRSLLNDNAKEVLWTIPSTHLVRSLENANFRTDDGQNFLAHKSNVQIVDSTSQPPSYDHSVWNVRCTPETAGVDGCTQPLRVLPSEATERFGLNDDTPVPCKKSSDVEVRHIDQVSSHNIGYEPINNGLAPSDCVGAPTSFDIEASAQARDSAMMRYKEKKKTRKYEKFVRYESRKLRAETRQRVRGRFVKANGLDYGSLFDDGIS